MPPVLFLMAVVIADAVRVFTVLDAIAPWQELQLPA